MRRFFFLLFSLLLFSGVHAKSTNLSTIFNEEKQAGHWDKPTVNKEKDISIRVETKVGSENLLKVDDEDAEVSNRYELYWDGINIGGDYTRNKNIISFNSDGSYVGWLFESPLNGTGYNYLIAEFEPLTSPLKLAIQYEIINENGESLTIEYYEEVGSGTSGIRMKLNEENKTAIRQITLQNGGNSPQEIFLKEIYLTNSFIEDDLFSRVAVSGESMPLILRHSEEYPWRVFDNCVISSNQGVENSSSWFSAEITLNEPGEISFDWAVCSEEDFDQLYFFINDELFEIFSGCYSGCSYPEFITLPIPLEAGDYVFRWQYEKDGGFDEGRDAAYIKNIKVTEEGYIPPAGLFIPDQELVLYASVGNSFVGSFEIMNQGTDNLTITGIENIAAPFSVQSYPDYPIAPGTSAYINISFAPEWQPEQFFEQPIRVQSTRGSGEIILKGYAGRGTYHLEMPGTLNNIAGPERQSITEVILLGPLDARDFRVLRDEFPVLSYLDLRGVFFIQDYEGDDGTIPGYNYYAANEIPASAMVVKGSLMKVILPENISAIREGAFFGCNNMHEINIPSSVYFIGAEAFLECNSLMRVDIPGSVSILGERVFANCFNLREVSVHWNPPVNISNNGMFDGTDLSYSTLYVPKDTKQYYENAAVWEYFGNIVETDEEVPHYGFYEAAVDPGSLPMEFTHSESFPWTAAQNYVMSSNQGQHNTSSWFATQVIASTNITLSFDWRVDSEERYDFLKFYINDELIESISGRGDQEFIAKEYILEPGIYSIKWEYSKDGSVNSYTDAGYIRNIKIWHEPISEEPVLNILNKEELNFGFVNYPDFSVLSLPVVNLGAQDLVISDINNEDPSFEFDYSSEPMPFAERREIQMKFIPAQNAKGVITANIEIVSNGGNQTVALKAYVNMDTIHVETPGTLHSLIPEEIRLLMTTLILTGTIDARDFRCIREMPFLTHIDMKDADIAAYEGEEGTNPWNYSYPANEIPYQGFYDAYNGITNNITSVVLPESATSFGEYVFNNSKISKVVIGSNIREIGRYAFYNTPQLKEIVLPEGLTEIKEYAFESSGLTSITLPASITSIQNRAFYYCNNLREVKAGMDLPVTISSHTFYNLDRMILVVPQGKVAHYKTSEAWRDFRYVLTLEEEKKEFPFDQLQGQTGSQIDGTTIHFSGGGEGGWWLDEPVDFSEYAYIVAEYEPNYLQEFYFRKGIIENKEDPESTLWESEEQMSAGSSIYVEPLSHYGNQGLISASVYNPSSYAADLTLKKVYLLKEETYPDVERSLHIHVDIPGTLGDLMTPEQKYLVTDLTVTGIIDIRDCIVMRNMPDLQNADLENTTVAAFYGNVDPDYNQWDYRADQFPIGGFRNSPSLRTMRLPNSINNVGNSAFDGCTYLENIFVPDQVTGIEYSAFRSCENLMSVRLSESLSFIGDRAFENCANLLEISIPDNVTEINSGAFMNCMNLETVILPESLSQISDDLFNYCIRLSNINLPSNITRIGRTAFSYCSSLTSLVIPESVERIEPYAFKDCESLSEVQLPSSLITIGSSAFQNCTSLTEIHIPNSVTSLESSAFADCTNLETVHLSSNLSQLAGSVFRNCISLSSLQYFTFSPVILTHDPFYGVNKKSCGLAVPTWAVDIFREANIWKDFLITEYTEEIKDIYINNPVTFDDRIRPVGQPNITVNPTGALRLEGGTPFDTDHFKMLYKENWRWQWGDDEWGQYYEYYVNSETSTVINEADHIEVERVSLQIEAQKNRWYYWCFPFDISISDIQANEEVQFVFRRYDGQLRAEIGTGASWQNMDKESVLTAGTGYIFQCSEDISNLTLTATSDTKQQLFDKEKKIIPLTEYYSENVSNRSWNFISNPYPSYFDLRGIEYTAPITVWNEYRYIAISPLDDIYILSPYQPFFVQKPNDLDRITFLPEGRQPDYQSRMDVPLRVSSNTNRLLIDLFMENQEFEDKTRVVINPEAALDYDLQYDAAKFLTSDNRVPQLYSLDKDNTLLAINERPLDKGVVRLGYSAGETGEYTISAQTKSEVAEIILIDKLLDISMDITQTDYSFETEKGSFNDRFELRISEVQTGTVHTDAPATTVNVVDQNIVIKTAIGNSVSVFTADGKKITMLETVKEEIRIPVPSGVYVVRINNEIFKVVVF